MNKIWLIIKREYLVRVRKKSFIVMTILGPLLMVAVMMVPIYLANETKEERLIAISEEHQEFNTQLQDTEYLHFTTIPDIESENLKNNFSESPFYALLYIENDSFILCSDQQISLTVTKDIEDQLERILQHKELKKLGIDLQILENSNQSITITTKIISEDGGSIKSKAEVSMGIGFFCGILIYIFIFSDCWAYFCISEKNI